MGAVIETTMGAVTRGNHVNSIPCKSTYMAIDGYTDCVAILLWKP